ncbi:hypothetical protein [Dickeya parazeae]|uniref:hypothetical protein n=1 Tax=Dickeya parazeae TaxID=2893572 RepID=UPI001AED0813|nr:hypothetical protein [Dickeya parazeae]MBP2834750.1 hypothetical protein [Dickeya parazeae]
MFICTELVFLLEVFADDCASVATDKGETQDNGGWHPAEPAPELVYTSIEGNWSALPPDLMYRLRELPVHQREVRRLMAVDFDDCLPLDIPEVVSTRQYRYTQLGLKALRLARRLRRLGGMPGSRRGSYPGSPQAVLLAAWHTARDRRDQRARACSAFTRTAPEVP